MSTTALLILADGAEEMEAVITADVLRRAGVKVTVAGLNGKNPVKCSRDIVIVPDVDLAEVADKFFDAVVLPGGLKGAESLAGSDVVKIILQEHEKSGKLVTAICAAPFAFKTHSIGIGKKITSHPCNQKYLSEGQYTYVEDRVVVDGNMITSRGPGTAFEFALAIVEKLLGKEKAQGLVSPMLLKL